MEPWFVLWSFLLLRFPSVLLSTIWPCMEQCCHFLAGAPKCYWELLDELQQPICMIVGPSFAGFLEPLAHHQHGATWSLFYKYYFGRCLSEFAQLVPLPYSQGSSTCYSDRLCDWSVTIPRCYKDVFASSFFLRTGRSWNSLPIECFPLTFYLNGLKSRTNRHLLTVAFEIVLFNCASFSWNSAPRSGCLALHGVNFN